jgi:cytochrome P450
VSRALRYASGVVSPSALSPRDLGFDPGDPGFIADPYPVFEELRQRHPVLYDERTDQWLVTRHEDVNRLLRDRRLGRTYLHQSTHAEMGRPEPPEWHAPFVELNGNGMLDREPPDHTRLRRLVQKAFTPRTVENLRPRVQALVDRYLDELVGAGEVDLIERYIEPLPVTVIAELLGIPEADRHRLRPWSRDICLMYELDPPDASAHKAVQASLEFSAYLRDLLTDRRRHPGTDLISAMAVAADEGVQLTDDELIGTCVLLLNAGHEASVNGAGNGWWTLFRHPGELARLRDDPALAATAIDELLRYDTPLALFERWVLDDIEVAGVRLPRGTEVALQFASANRDPAAFDRPAALDLGRDPNPHVSFGAGIHYCLGAPLAKLELQIAFATLLRRAPDIELLEAPTWKPTYVLRGLQALKVRL